MSEKIKNTFLSGAISLSISAVIVKIIGVVYKIPLTYLLGDTGMGYFNTAYTIYSFFYVIASAGVPKAMAIMTVEANTEDDKNRAGQIYRAMLRLFLVLGILLTLLLVILAEPLSVIIGNSKASITLVSVAPTIVFIAISGVMKGYLNGLASLVPVAISQFIEAIAKLILGLVFAIIGVRLSLPISVVSAMTMLGITIGSIFSALYLYIQTFPKNNGYKARQKIEIPPSSVWTRMLKIALPITLSASVLSLANVIDLALIMRGLKSLGYTEESASGLYGNYTTLALPMLNLIVSILTPISVAILPKLVELHSLGDNGGFNKTFVKGVEATMIIAFPCAFAFFLYSFDALDILFDSWSATVGAPLLALSSVSVVMLPYLTILNTALEAKGMLIHSMSSILFGVAIKSIMTALLIPHLGIYAAPISSGVSYLCSSLLSTIFLGAIALRVPLICLLLPFIVSAFSFIPIYILLYASGIIGSGAIAVIPSVGLSFLLYFAICLIFIRNFIKQSSATSQSTQKTHFTIM